MKITLPASALIVLIGPSGAGKSTFARRHFLPTEIISSDYCRGLVSDDENSLAATADAFDVVHFIAGKRLAGNRLTVIDATSVRPDDRKPLIALARAHHCLPIAIVLDLPERLCHERNRSRPDRQFGPHVVRRQRDALRRSLNGLRREGFRGVYVLSSTDEVDTTTITREPLQVDRRDLAGPFDIIGDVHGCYDELVQLLEQLGYVVATAEDAPHGIRVSHPEGRRAVFVGDLVDRGPATPAVLRLVMSMVAAETGICVAGNHENKLLRKLNGRDVQITHGLGETLAQLDQEPPTFVEQARTFLDGLRSHYVLDGGKLVVAHAGLPESMQGRASAAVREFALYGDTTGERDEYGLPVRLNWAAEYRGSATVVYGHTAVTEPEWLNNTIDVDTGCVFGGALTALRYPERTLVSVPAARTYYAPVRPLPTAAVAFAPTTGPGQATRGHDDLLSIDDVLGRRAIATRLGGTVTIREENAAAALEVLSRFAVDPRWLIYLPPTMSPSETSKLPGLLEHPNEAFAYFRSEGVERVVCEEKHMGSRVATVVCRDPDVARQRFGASDGEIGICLTRTGRRFFDDLDLELAVLDRIRTALEAVDLWSTLDTPWVLLDGELMPWSAKAQGLIRRQYAAVGAASRTALADAITALEQALAWNTEAADTLRGLATTIGQRDESARRYVDTYRRYCWPVASIHDLALAPFQVLASEGAVHLDRDHAWQMETLAGLCRADAESSEHPLLRATPFRVVDLADDATVADATGWWETLTAAGGEGIVVKPLQPLVHGTRGLVQPALKVRGSEYLRIIYGPDYTAPEHLRRLRSRGVGRKRSLALREFALGIEALERFVKREPLYRVHECVAAVLALESEPVDPRL
jgi:protein phosphatase